jgi:2-hydroxy-3-keto-5-methylthiopentenyl-1-phosphate phosphatase
MMPTIRAVLSNLLPAEDANSIDIIANEVKYTDPEQKGDEWEIVYRHPESHYGHDKSKAILPYKDLEDRPTLFFCGDGVSGMSHFLMFWMNKEEELMIDLSAAAHADVLFTKVMANGDSDLMAYCKREHIPHVPFTDL